MHPDQIYVFGALPLEHLDAPDEDENDQKEKPTKVNITSEYICSRMIADYLVLSAELIACHANHCGYFSFFA